MDLRQLRYFITVVAEGSFSAAAARLHVAQPSLSVAIRNLERETGGRLLTRGARGVTPTESGRVFLTYARSTLRESEKAIDEVRATLGAGRGRVSVGVTALFNTFVTPAALTRFHRANPGVEVRIDLGTHDRGRIIGALDSGEWDFAFAILTGDTVIPPSVAVAPVMTMTSGAYAAAGHPLAGKRAIPAAELARYDWVITFLSAGPSFLERIFARARVKPPNIVTVSNSFVLNQALIAATACISILPHEMAAADVAAGRIVRLDQSIVKAQSTAALMSSKRLELTPSARRLMEAFREAAAADARVAPRGGPRRRHNLVRTAP